MEYCVQVWCPYLRQDIENLRSNEDDQRIRQTGIRRKTEEMQPDNIGDKKKYRRFNRDIQDSDRKR